MRPETVHYRRGLMELLDPRGQTFVFSCLGLDIVDSGLAKTLAQ